MVSRVSEGKQQCLYRQIGGARAILVFRGSDILDAFIIDFRAERRAGRVVVFWVGSQKESNSVCIDSFGGARAIPVFRGSDILDAFIIDLFF